MPLSKPLNLHMLTMIVRSIFKDKDKFYAHVYLDKLLYELIFQKKLMLIKQMHQKNMIFVTIGILKILLLNINHIFAIAVLI